MVKPNGEALRNHANPGNVAKPRPPSRTQHNTFEDSRIATKTTRTTTTTTTNTMTATITTTTTTIYDDQDAPDDQDNHENYK